MYKKIIGLFCVALMVTIVGCGESHPALTIVTGTVTYDGKPLADATVAIMPDGGDGTAKNAVGDTDAEGKFTLATTFPTSGSVAGAVQGNYVLRVFKFEKVDIEIESGEPPADGADPSSEMMAMMNPDSDDLDPGGAESLINNSFNLTYSTGSGWDNKCVVGAIESPTTFKITLNSNGTGKIE
jgi:hypothetical protein